MLLTIPYRGKKELEVRYEGATRFTVDFTDFATKISILIEENIVDPELRSWIVPTFSTTTQNDIIVTSIVIMGTLQHYFQYGSACCCGIPSVKLPGEKSDYEYILRRLDKLEQCGDEPLQFSRLLRPILTRFIRSMDEPDSPDVIDLWHNVCLINGGSGVDYYNGWIPAFCFWNKEGRVQLGSQSTLRQHYSQRQSLYGPRVLCLDDIYYGEIASTQVPAGYVKLPVDIHDNRQKVKAKMLSGSVGINCPSSGRIWLVRMVGLELIPCRRIQHGSYTSLETSY